MVLRVPLQGNLQCYAPLVLIQISTSQLTGRRYRRAPSTFKPHPFVSAVYTVPDISITRVSVLTLVSDSNDDKSPVTTRTPSLAPGSHISWSGGHTTNIFLSMPTEMRWAIFDFLRVLVLSANRLARVRAYLPSNTPTQSSQKGIPPPGLSARHAVTSSFSQKALASFRREKGLLQCSLARAFLTQTTLDMPTSTMSLFGARDTTPSQRRWHPMMSCANGQPTFGNDYVNFPLTTPNAWTTRSLLGLFRNSISPPIVKTVARTFHSTMNPERGGGIWKAPNGHGSGSKVVGAPKIKGLVSGVTLWTTSLVTGIGANLCALVSVPTSCALE